MAAAVFYFGNSSTSLSELFAVMALVELTKKSQSSDAEPSSSHSEHAHYSEESEFEPLSGDDSSRDTTCSEEESSSERDLGSTDTEAEDWYSDNGGDVNDQKNFKEHTKWRPDDQFFCAVEGNTDSEGSCKADDEESTDDGDETEDDDDEENLGQVYAQRRFPISNIRAIRL